MTVDYVKWSSMNHGAMRNWRRSDLVGGSILCLGSMASPCSLSFARVSSFLNDFKISQHEDDGFRRRNKKTRNMP